MLRELISTVAGPLDFVYRPAFGNALPFAIGSGADFLPAPPPPLNSWTYTLSLAETQAFGRRNSAFRTKDQTHLAAWWLELNEIQWGRIMRQLTQTRGLPLLEAVRMFALVNMANSDATLAVWHAKNHYAFWRPETAIAGADADDNPRTEPDSTFKPFITTPCHPSYPAGHGVTAGAARRVLERIYGVGPHAIEISNRAVPDVRLRYTSLQEIADDIDDARIYGGIHFRFDQQAGGRQGRRVASHILGHQLRPARRTTSGPAQDKGAK